MKPPSPRRRHFPDGGSGAFTLLEMLIVVSIAGVLLTLAIRSVGPVLQAANLSSAGSMVVDQLEFARQTALSRNRAVEVRFYGPTTGNDPQLLTVTALRLVLIEENGTEKPLGKVLRLPPSIIISCDHTDPDKSSLLKASASPQGSPRAGLEPSPVAGDFTRYAAFQFVRSGGTDLDVNTQASWHLTIRPENAPLRPNLLPANYITIQLDPLSGRTRVYRP